MSDATAPCPSCGTPGARSRGEIPAGPGHFAGNALNKPMLAGELFECHACHLFFRHPRPSAAELKALYAGVKSDYWAYKLDERYDWRRTIEILNAACKNGAVLDIGCHDGAFLTFLGAGFKRFGIEMNSNAAAIAKASGIEIAGAELSAAERLPPLDAITAFDVIEHVPDPLAFVTAAARRLKPGGMLILASGNAQARTWQFMESDYWYCAMPEHISFISPEWVETAAGKTGLKIERIEAYSHDRNPTLLKFAYESISNLIYKISPPLAFWLKKKFVSVGRGGSYTPVDTPPSWGTAKDHIFVVLTKE